MTAFVADPESVMVVAVTEFSQPHCGLRPIDGHPLRVVGFGGWFAPDSRSGGTPGGRLRALGVDR